MHSNIDITTQQGIVNLFCEESLAADVSKWLIQHLVACCLDDNNLQSAIFRQLWKCSLKQAAITYRAAGATLNIVSCWFCVKTCWLLSKELMSEHG